MPSNENTNPYDEEDEPDLHKAWAKGYRAAKKGIPPRDGLLHDADEAPDAWLDGYAATQRES